jgi:hypothetical protein
VKAAPRSCRVHADGKAGERQSERIILPICDRRLRMTDRGRSILFTQTRAKKAIVIAHRRKTVRQCVSGIKGERAFQEWQRLCRALGHAGIDVGLCPQHEVVRVETIGAFTLDALNFRLAQAGFDRTDSRQ